MIRVAVCLLLGAGVASCATAAAVDPDVLRQQAQRVAAIARAKPCVISIFARQGQNGGSGVVISPDGYALSNFHVTSSTGDVMLCGMADGQLYHAVVVGIDPTGDVALIKLMGRDDFPAATITDSDLVRVGDRVFAMGNPFLLATDFQPSVSFGMVSGVHRYQYPSGTLLEYTDCIQTDAAVNPGNSGGPLFDAEGRLIGINGRCSFEKRGRVNVGVAYAISINQIQNFLWDLKSGRFVDHATLGALVERGEQGRIVVKQILEESDAYRRGLRRGDEIVSFAGRPIRTVNTLKNVLGLYPAGWDVALAYRRDGTTYDVTASLSAVHRAGELEQLMLRQRPHQTPKVPQPRRQNPGGSDRPSRKKDPSANEDQPPIPPEVAAQYEPRKGFANYHFNALHQRRIWSGSLAQGDFTSLHDTWHIACDMDGGAGADFQLGDKAALSRLPGGESALLAEDELSTSLDPPGSGGLLLSLHLWRRWLTTGPEGCERLYYLGRRPLEGHPQPVDVLVARYSGVVCHLYYDPANATLLAIVVYPAEYVDPCQIHFGAYQEIEGRWQPGQFEVVYGDTLFGVFKINALDFDAEQRR